MSVTILYVYENNSFTQIRKIFDDSIKPSAVEGTENDFFVMIFFPKSQDKNEIIAKFLSANGLRQRYGLQWDVDIENKGDANPELKEHQMVMYPPSVQGLAGVRIQCCLDFPIDWKIDPEDININLSGLL